MRYPFDELLLENTGKITGKKIDAMRQMSREYDEACKEFGVPKCSRCYYHNGVTENYKGLCDECLQHLLHTLPQGVYGDPQSEEVINLLNEVKASIRQQLAKYSAPIV